jgi:protein phosphatase
MGGHAGGGTASRIAVETIDAEIRKARARPDNPFEVKGPIEDSPVPEVLRGAVETACANIFGAAQNDSRWRAWAHHHRPLVHRDLSLHRARRRSGLLSAGPGPADKRGHSLSTSDPRRVEFSAEEAHCPQPDIITRSVGLVSEVEVDVMGLVLQSGHFHPLLDGCRTWSRSAISSSSPRARHRGIPQALIDRPINAARRTTSRGSQRARRLSRSCRITGPQAAASGLLVRARGGIVRTRFSGGSEVRRWKTEAS